MISLEACLNYAINNQEFVEQYKRLTGARLGSGAPIERIVDESTGLLEKELRDFFDFVKEYVWLRIP